MEEEELVPSGMSSSGGGRSAGLSLSLTSRF